MYEKKTMGYFAENYPGINAKKVEALMNKETGKVEAYREEDAGGWAEAEKDDRFFDTLKEAERAQTKQRADLLAKMPEVKKYLAIMEEWREDNTTGIPFKLEDYLPSTYAYRLRDRDRVYDRYNEQEQLADDLTEYIRTGRLNIDADTFKEADVKKVEWGTVKARLILADGTNVETCSRREFELVRAVFGFNTSGKTYNDLEDLKDIDDEDDDE